LRSVVLCPFAAGTALWQAQSGAWTLTVCVRGTFSLVHGREAVLADVQEPVAGDRYVADDPRRSLYTPSDLVPYKPRVDVVLVGSAFAPDHDPVEALVARLSVGTLDKSIGVIGDRLWIEGPDGPEPSSPRPFVTMPLGYERVARGPHNPHGFDLIRAPQPGALALPNLEAVDDEIGGGRTVGFGPVAPSAGARRGLLRGDGWAWVEGGGLGPAPAGFDFAFYNAAPPDQQVDVLRGGDALVLENLDRGHARLETRLPSVRPKAFLVPADVDRGIEIALRCDTVWIDTDRKLLTLSWRGLVTVDTPDEEALGALVIAAESKGREIGYAQITKLLRESTMSTTDSDTLTESRPLRPRSDSLRDVDPDLLPTPGPFRAKRPLPTVDVVTAPGGTTPPVTLGDAPTSTGIAAKVPAPARAPIVIEAEDTGGPVSWEELTGSDLIDASILEEPKTLTRIDLHRATDGAPSAGDPHANDEPSTRPVLMAPRQADLGAADYARIAVAVERGDAARTLFDYGLTLPDLPRVQRAWSERSAADPTFAHAFASAIATARRG
jgi:hypothetical protein